MFVFKLVILICAVSTPAEDCVVGTAHDVLRTEVRYETPIACVMDGTASLADLSRGAVDDPTRWRVKILCPREARIAVGSAR